MNIPGELKYSPTHEWARLLEGGGARIGLTDYAQSQLSDLVFVNLCAEGEELDIHGLIGDVESIKAVSEVYSPLGGTVVKINQEVLDDPSLINSDPYGAWLIELADVSGLEELISPEDYAKLLEKEA